MRRSSLLKAVGATVAIVLLAMGVGAAKGAGATVNFVLAWGGQPVAIFPNGDVYVMNFPGGSGEWLFRSNVFGGNAAGRTIVSADERLALASTGEVFYNLSTPGNGPWVNLGIPPGGMPTTANRKSWGELKGQFR
jgi:hypothetical protein